MGTSYNVTENIVSFANCPSPMSILEVNLCAQWKIPSCRWVVHVTNGFPLHSCSPISLPNRNFLLVINLSSITPNRWCENSLYLSKMLEGFIVGKSPEILASFPWIFQTMPLAGVCVHLKCCTVLRVCRCDQDYLPREVHSNYINEI